MKQYKKQVDELGDRGLVVACSMIEREGIQPFTLQVATLESDNTHLTEKAKLQQQSEPADHVSIYMF